MAPAIRRSLVTLVAAIPLWCAGACLPAAAYASSSVPVDGVWICYQYKTITVYNPDGAGQESVPVPVPLPQRVATSDPHCPPPD